MEHLEPYAAPILKLLRGSISEDTDTREWERLLVYEKQIRDYLRKIGLTLHLDKVDCYAFLKQSEHEDESENPVLPRLTRKRMISKRETLLLVLLRESLLDIEEKNAASAPILRRDEIHEKLSPFFPVTLDEVERKKDFDRIIGRIVDLGFLKDMKNEHFKIERIIKARVSLDELDVIKNKFSQGASDDGTILPDVD
jgi:hypothetical protein